MGTSVSVLWFAVRMGSRVTAIAGCGNSRSAGGVAVWRGVVMALGWGLWWQLDGERVLRRGWVGRSVMWRRGGAGVGVPWRRQIQ
jgi:hypothetical protein